MHTLFRQQVKQSLIPFWGGGGQLKREMGGERVEGGREGGRRWERRVGGWGRKSLRN